MAETPLVAEKPAALSISDRVYAGAFFGVCLMALYAMMASPFVPNPLGHKVALAGGAVAAAWMVWASLFGRLSPANPKFAKTAETRRWARNPAVRVVGFGLFGFILMYQAVGGGLESVWTDIAGARGAQTTTITGWHRASRYSCHSFDVAGTGWLGGHGLCADSAYAPEAIPGRILVLTGRVSALGVNVEGFRLGPRPAEAGQGY